MSEIYFNRLRQPAARFPFPTRNPLTFHSSIPGYVPTPLRNLPRLAERLGVSRVWVKDESNRFGLPAFKILGASWAAYRCLLDRFGTTPDRARTFDELKSFMNKQGTFSFSTATDGNHGRAVAWMARALGIQAHVFMPKGSASSRVKAIEAEGASVTIVEGSYDEAVEKAADLAGEGVIVLQDTGYAGYETIPSWIVEGYSTMLWEVEDAWKEEGVQYPTHVFVQIGVGSLAEAVIRHFRVMGTQPVIVGVEPTGAACVMESTKAGKVVTLPGHQNSIMAGLNCGTPSTISFPQLRRGIDCFISIEDEKAMEAMRLFASAGITAGETGRRVLEACLRSCFLKTMSNVPNLESAR